MKKVAIRSTYDVYAESPETLQPEVPAWCPVCSATIRNEDDRYAYSEFSCCSLCASVWARKDAAGWSSGWRPSPAELEQEMQRRREYYL